MRRILVVSAFLWLAGLPLGNARGENLELPFEVEASQAAILVRGLADGKPVVLILDTGSSQTILAHDLVRLAPGALDASRFATEGPGMNANGRYTEANLELAGRLWRNRTVVGMNLDEVSKAYGRRIDGLLGQDLLREFDRVTIDFRSKRILLSTGTGRIGARR